jgi:hypothetical protein
MRIALQAGVPQRAVPDEIRAGGRWLLIRSEEEAHAAEDGWMVRHTAAEGKTPGPWLVRLAVRKFGPALLHGDGSNLIVAGIAFACAAIGLALSWFGLGATGLLFAGTGWIVGRAWALLDRLRCEALAQPGGTTWRPALFDIGFDAAIVTILTLILPVFPGQMVAERAFAPVMLVGLLRLLARGQAGGWSVWASDRFLLVLVLAATVAGGVIWPAVPALAALLLLAGLVLRPEDPAGGLTRA